MKVGVVGASGYAGVELLRLCAGHPELEVVVATAGGHRGQAGGRPHPVPGCRLSHARLRADRGGGAGRSGPGVPGPAPRSVPAPGARPHRRVGAVVDLAADFRLSDPSLYPTWYGEAHSAPELLGRFVYGLPELHRDELRGARLIAAPGCYPTAALLALAPLVRAGVLARPGAPAGSTPALIVDAASGVVGGRAGPEGPPPLRRGGRGLRGLRAARPPAHRRDGAGPRGPGPVHPPPGPDGPGHPGHLLRPARPTRRPDHRRRPRRPAPGLRRRALRGGHRRVRRRPRPPAGRTAPT